MPRTPIRSMLAVLMLSAAAAQADPCGDVASDGRTDVADAVAVLRRAVLLEVPTAAEIAEGDVAPLASIDTTTVPPTATPRPDGVLDIADVVQLLRFSVGLAALPGCAPAAVQVPRIGHVDRLEICSGGTLVATVTNPGALPVGDVRWSAGTASVLSQRDVPGGMQRVIALTASVQDAWGELSMDGVLGTRGIRAVACSSAPVVVQALPGWIDAGQGGIVLLAGDGLLCVEAVTLRGPDGVEVGAEITDRISDQALELRLPDHPWQPLDLVEVIASSPCGTSPAPRPVLVMDDVITPRPDATSLSVEGTGLAQAGTTEAATIRIEGTNLDAVSAVRFGDHEIGRGAGCEVVGGDVLCAAVSPGGLHASLTVPVTVLSDGGADPTPLEFSWIGIPAPRCGDVRPAAGAAGTPVVLEIVGEHLFGIQGARVGTEELVGHPIPDGRSYPAGGFLPLTTGEAWIRLEVGEPWDLTCPVAVLVE